MGILSINEIMEAEDITEKEVPVEEWGGSVVVRSISHREMRDIKAKIEESGGDTEDGVEKWVFIKGLINPQITEEDYERLLDKSTQAITKILTEILGRSNTNKEAVKEEERNFHSEPERILPVPTGGENVNDGTGIVNGQEGTAQPQ